MKLKLLNLNLYNYNSWAERKPKIIKFIKKHNPDIVVLQEVRDDVKFNKKGNNQAKQLNKELKYEYYSYYPVADKRKDRPTKYKRFCVGGSAILSKFPLENVEKKKLKKHEKDVHTCGNLYVKVKAKKDFGLLAVHFSNNSYFSLLHLLETLRYIEKKGTNPIIVGDFNIIDSHVLHDATEKTHKSSLQYKKYISYPKGKFTLDYILIPKKYKFKSLKCLGKDLSDHKALLSEIEVK